MFTSTPDIVQHLRKIVPRQVLLPSVTPSTYTESVTLYWVTWPLLSMQAITLALTHPKMSKQGNAAKRKLVTLIILWKLDVTIRLETGEAKV